MDFSLSEEQLMIIDGAKRFAQERLAPQAEELDRKGESNVDALRELGKLGYMGMIVPAEYGGSQVGAVA
jgi:alkylation response protein AidB-like acyl-CoA dehydrogenase